MYTEVEKKLDIKQQRYQINYCGTSWLFLREKAKIFSSQLLSPEDDEKFIASPGWFSNVLKRFGFEGSI